MVGIYGWLAIEGVYREPGEWRVEHWANGDLEGAGTGWHKLFTAYFTIPSRAMLSISPDSFHFIEFIASFDSPGSSPTGLTFDGTYLWNADASANTIYKLDLSGTIIASFDSPGSSPKGLASDGTYLWVADDSDDKIYKWVTQSVNIGSSVSQTFTIISSGDENLEIETFTITGADTSEFTTEKDTCSGQTLTPMETCTFDVAFSPSSAGKKTASLEISSNDVFSKKIVPLSGTGEKGNAMPWIPLLLLGE